ncbi:MAG: diphthine synthase [Candidatus Hydrothermarchaeales archaeon]
MLIFIGLGLHDEKDITLKGLEEARSCDKLFAEFYTSALAGAGVEKISALTGRDIETLGRRDIEEDAEDGILKLAKSKKVGLLVAGDPLISTTHVQLRLQAKELGIETRVVHNASIYSASASISGLQNYKFGRSASVPFPQKGFLPETPYDVVKENGLRGLHTLLFLDIRVDRGQRLMTANEAMEILLDIEKKRGEGVFTEETLCVVLGNVGAFECVLKAGKVKELIDQDFGPTPHSLIVPGELHFMEEEYLNEFAGLDSAPAKN